MKTVLFFWFFYSATLLWFGLFHIVQANAHPVVQKCTATQSGRRAVVNRTAETRTRAESFPLRSPRYCESALKVGCYNVGRIFYVLINTLFISRFHIDFTALNSLRDLFSPFKADLAEIPCLSKSNNRIKLVFICVLSKLMYLEPLTKKNLVTIAQAFKKIFDRLKTKPLQLKQI